MVEISERRMKLALRPDYKPRSFIVKWFLFICLVFL